MLRPILKQHPELTNQQLPLPEPFPFAACPSVLLSPHVHFPPTPTLTSTFTTHSPTTYDRTPVFVPPNSCALPGRHEREFVETQADDQPWSPRQVEHKGSYFHPHAYEACSLEPSGCSPPSRSPPLIPDAPYDISSESEDSDGQIMTPPDPTSAPAISVRFAAHNISNPMIPYSHTQEEIESVLSFLPHAPPSLKEKRAGRRSCSHTRTHKAPRKESENRSPDHSDFAAPSLDFEGCLGGF